MGHQGHEHRSTAAPSLRTAVAYLPRVEGRLGENDWYFCLLSIDSTYFMETKDSTHLVGAAQRWIQHHSVRGPEGIILCGVSSVKQVDADIKDWDAFEFFSLCRFSRSHKCSLQCSEGDPLPDDILKLLDEA